MKKTLFILCALLLTAVGARADVDYSYKLFASTSTWSAPNSDSGYAGTYAGNGAAESYLTGTYTAAMGKILYQTVSGLPAGTYELKFYAVANCAWSYGGNAATTNTTQVFANSAAAQTLNVAVDNDLHTDSKRWLDADLFTFSVTLGDNEDLVYGIQNVGSGGNWYICEGYSLILQTEETVLSLEKHDVIIENEASFSPWSIAGNSAGSFQRNTWSDEGDNDGSGMTTPFIEYWVGTGNSLSAATISYRRQQSLPKGSYSISIDARAYDEGSTDEIASNTILIKANSASVDITTGTKNTYTKSDGTTSAEVYGTYTLTAAVDESGTLDISITVAASSKCDWIAFKNLKVVYLGETEPDHSCEAEFDHWSISGNTGGSFQRNTWSTEADPSGMTTPFIEYWVGAGNNLSDATISHTTLTGLTAGYYEVSIFARAFNENSLVDVSEGITFNANDESIDLNKETHATYNHVSAEEYGTYKVYCQVTDEGKLDINFKLSSVNCDWLAFKNLDVVYCGTELSSLPTLEEATGTMNSTIASAQTTALTDYTTSIAAYNAAYQAVECARFSAEFYASVAAFVETLDDTGKTVFSATTNGSDYANNTLDYCDMSETYAAAQAGQTTAGTDWSYVQRYTGTWMKDAECTNNTSDSNYGSNFGVDATYPSAHEAWRETVDFTASETHPRKPIYKMIENLPAGEYEISFYAYAAQGTVESGTIYAFANEATTTVAFDDAGSGPNWSSNGGPYTLTCNVNVEGTLRFGMESTGKGAWYVMEENSLTLVSLATEEPTDTDSEYQKGDEVTVNGTTYTIQCDNMVENHSFELGFEGWTSADNYTSEITSEYFELRSGSANDAQDGNVYLVGATNNGVSSVGSLGTAWSIKTGKKYYMSYYVKGLTGATDGGYLKTSLTSSPGTESKDVGTPTVTSEWQKVEYVFDSDSYSYVQIDFRWLDNQWAFDNFQIYEIEELPSEVKWEMTDAGWGTLILPFAADIPTTDDSSNAITWTAYSCAGLASDDETLTLTNETTLVANTPYILSGDAGTYTFKGTPVALGEGETLTAGMLTGTFVDMDYDALFALESGGSTVYLLQNHNGDVAFYPVVETSSAAATLTPYHCYLTTSSGSGVRAHIDFPSSDGEATAIVAVEGAEAEANGAIYDLSGRKVSKAVKGVYIQNGKKVLVK